MADYGAIAWNVGRKYADLDAGQRVPFSSLLGIPAQAPGNQQAEPQTRVNQASTASSAPNWLKRALTIPHAAEGDTTTPDINAPRPVSGKPMSEVFWNETNMGQALGSIISGVTLPRDVYQGKVDPNSDAFLQRQLDMAGLAMTGGIGGVAPGGTVLGAGPARRTMTGQEKELADLRRKYQGQAARTHPLDWSYKLGDEAPPTLPVRDFDINQLKQGDTLHALVGDRSRVSAPLAEINGQRLPAQVTAEGGADYMRTPGGIWASERPIISRLQKQAAQSTGTPYALTQAMGPKAIDYSHHAWEPLLWQMGDAPAGMAARKQFDEEFRGRFKGWPGVDKPEESLQYLQSEKTGARAPFVNQLQRGDYQKQGFPEPGPVRWAMTEPDLRGVDTGATGYGVSRLDPQGQVMPQAGHSSYSTGLPGTYEGRLAELLPYDAVWRDWAARPDVAKLPPSKSANKLYKFSRDLPVQTVDQQLLDDLGRRIEAAKRGR